MRCFQQNFITPFIYSKIGSTSSGAALAAAVPALPELRNPQSAAAASEQAVNAAPDLPVPLFSRPVPGCAAVPWILALIWAHNSDLLLNFVFKLYHKTCEQFYRNFGLHEKSPNSFLPGLPRSIINQFRFHNLLCLCLASVHLPHPFHLVFGFQLLGHAVLLCQ